LAVSKRDRALARARCITKQLDVVRSANPHKRCPARLLSRARARAHNDGTWFHCPTTPGSAAVGKRRPSALPRGPYAPLGLLGHGALTDSFSGIVLAEIFEAAPFLIIAARSAFASVDPVLEDVAATLGRGRLATFIKVSLPLAWPAIRAGLLLAWLRAFGEFGATVMVAYHPYTLPVYMYVAFGSQGLPAMMPILLPALGAAIAFSHSVTLALARHRGARRSRLVRRMPRRVILADRNPSLDQAPSRFRMVA
jgi:Binding-protein-dependent transport system inner membrane component